MLVPNWCIQTYLGLVVIMVIIFVSFISFFRFCNANISSTVISQSKLATSTLGKQLGKGGTHTTVFRKQELALVKSHWQVSFVHVVPYIGALASMQLHGVLIGSYAIDRFIYKKREKYVLNLLN